MLIVSYDEMINPLEILILSWPGFFGQRAGVYKCKAALG